MIGSFLVNNLPVARLPYEILHDPEYKRVFGDFVFEVQPEDKNTFISVRKYSDCIYKFEQQTHGFIIVECHKDGTEIELIPSKVLKDELPHVLVNTKSHWWNKRKHIIDFRTKLFDTKDFLLESGIEYRLHLTDNRLIHLKTKRKMLDVTSHSFKSIVKHLSRLESQKFIHILLDTPTIASIELVRMNLKFKINISDSTLTTYDIVSNEFSQMRVAFRQKFGTLYGLNHGLLLENVEQTSAEKLLLLPHGEINAKMNDNHVSVEIDIDSELRSPPFHLYRIDNTLRQIKATNNTYSAWFYLAYLHAITSHGEGEPFTGISGTESALQILHSGFIWSSIPYDGETIQILKYIANLSPKRRAEGRSQKVEWPDFIPSRSAQDSFIFIAAKLLEDSQRLHGFHSVEKHTLEYSERCSRSYTDIKLNLRDYLRHLECSPNLRVSNKFIQHEIIQTKLLNTREIKLSTNLRLLSYLHHTNEYQISHNFNLWQHFDKNHSINLLYNLNELKENLNRRHNNICNDWITFYEAIRTGQLNRETFLLILSWMAYKCDNDYFDAFMALQSIERNKEAFKDIHAPAMETYYLYAGFYEKSKVLDILNGFNFYEFFSMNREISKPQILADLIDSAWPCEQFDIKAACATRNITINVPLYGFENRNSEMNSMLKAWNYNRKLKDFCDNVQNKLSALSPFSSSAASLKGKLPNLRTYEMPSAKNWPKHEVNYTAKMIQVPREFVKHVHEAKLIWNLKPSNSNLSSKNWWNIYESIVTVQIGEHFIDAGMHRLTPSNVLPNIIAKQTNNDIKAIIGAMAVTIVHEQRKERINKLSRQSELKPDFDKENENKPHMNWKPSEYPEWIIFEIEVCILNCFISWFLEFS